MAARKTKTRPTGGQPEEIIERILDVDVSSEMESSYLEYAYSVIYSRALPDARDGLKPVQRRILYSMRESGVLPDRSYVKCARVVGQVMGVLHPHGDAAIYDALVRMAQPWVMRLPVVDGHGNFGAPDAPPAAMRYTECRMHSAAMAMTDGMDKETVDFQSNYDGKESEPQVLPAAFPNLLVNGAGGIAVGMATNCAPHNLVEVVQALRHLLKHPDADTDALMKFIPGPDLPTGGKIIGLDGVRDAYRTGKGSFKIRATARIEPVSPRRKGIVITELPFNVGPERILEQIKSLVSAKKLKGISDLKDLSDLANGTRIMVEVKNGFNPDALLEQLYKQTKLEDSFAINAVALVDEQPRTLSLKDMLEVYLQHRLDVTLRRCTYDRDKAADRLHLVEGLLTAIVDIDDVIAIIRSSEDTASARSRLMEVFELTQAQANFILDMQLRRLTKYSTIELESERDDLQNRITELTEIIDNDAQLRTLVGNELAETAKTYGTPRRTILLSSSGVTTAASSEPLEIADDPCWVLLSSAGLLARTEQAGPLPGGGDRTNHDVIISAIQTTARGDYGLITTAGRIIRGNALDLPTVPVTATAPTLQGGVHASELIITESGERVLALCRLSDQAETIALGTKRGIVKRVNPEILNKDTWDIVRLEDDDEVAGALELSDPDAELIFVSDDAQMLRFPASAVRPQGRSGGGIAGIKLGAGSQVAFFGAVPSAAADDAVLVTVAGSADAIPGTEAGSIKVTPLAEYPIKGRATGGVRCHRFRTGEDGLLFAWAGRTPAIAAADSGAPVDLPAADGRRDGSGDPAPQPIAAAASRTIPAV